MSLSSINRQQGAALMVLVFVMVLGLTGYWLKAIDHEKLMRARTQKTMQSLGEAKQALMAWAVNNSVNLGQLPFPDRAGGGGYDGFSDCSPSGTAFETPASYRFLIGKLPVYGQTSPCVGQQVGLGLDNNEHLENRLWYAVSRNVVHQYEYLSADVRSNPIINPSIIDAPAYPWLKVLDRNGQLISDRVAAVIIAPNANIGMQSRAEGAAPKQFLDALYIDGVQYANYDYDSADEDFMMGGDISSIDVNDSRFRPPYLFNDQLVYITVDELVHAINKRVIAESKWLLTSYKSKAGHFPHAADFNLTTIQSDSYSAGNRQSGLVPFDITDNCQCVSATQCSCRFGVIESVSMYRNNGTWKSAEDTGACTSTLKASGKECTCTGAGSCSRSYSTYTTRLICDAFGSCTTQNLTSSTRNKWTYKLANFMDVYGVSEHCQIIRGHVQCNGDGSFQIGLNEASWLKQNGWQQYVYYAWSPSHQLQAGTQEHLDAVLIAMGKPILSENNVKQSRPSSLMTDYLDSAENADGDAIYESVLKKTNEHYNDEVFIISP